MSCPLGFLLFFTEGFPSLLEGYSLAIEDTSDIDFETVAFSEIRF